MISKICMLLSFRKNKIEKMKKLLKIETIAIIILTFCFISNSFATDESSKTSSSISITTEPQVKEYREKEKNETIEAKIQNIKKNDTKEQRGIESRYKIIIKPIIQEIKTDKYCF